jgi:hypothetical protein
MTAGPGKMWALTMGAQRTMERGPAVYWSWTVSVGEVLGQRFVCEGGWIDF